MAYNPYDPYGSSNSDPSGASPSYTSTPTPYNDTSKLQQDAIDKYKRHNAATDAHAKYMADKRAKEVAERKADRLAAAKETPAKAATATPATTAPATTTKAMPETAEDKAAKAAQMAAFGATNQAMRASQAGGLSAAAGANAGAQAGTDAYTSTYGPMALGYSGQDLQKVLAKMGIDWQKLQAGQNQQGQWLQAGAAALPWVLSLFTSDKNKKTDIRDGSGVLDEVANSVRGAKYKYKGSDHEEYGVMAQDLEKTPLASTVFDTPDGKKVDTQRLTTANTAMISELSRKNDELANKLDKALAYIGRQK